MKKKTTTKNNNNKQTNKNTIKMSSAAVVVSALRVNSPNHKLESYRGDSVPSDSVLKLNLAFYVLCRY